MDPIEETKEDFVKYDDLPQQLFEKSDEDNCNCVLWGKWPQKESHTTPLFAQFKMEDNEIWEGRVKLKKMVFGFQFKLLLFNNGQLFSIGICDRGK